LIYVRGGDSIETAVLLDRAFLGNPFHWGGGVSILNPHFVDEVEFFAGGFPAEYGQAQSGIVAVKNRRGNSERLRADIQLDGTGGDMLFEGPLGERNTYMVGVRRTYYDFVASLFDSAAEGSSLPHFADGQLKLDHAFAEDARISWNSVFSTEGVDFTFSEGQESRRPGASVGDRFYNRDRSVMTSVDGSFPIGTKGHGAITGAYVYRDGESRYLSASVPSYADWTLSEAQLRADAGTRLGRHEWKGGLFANYLHPEVESIYTNRTEEGEEEVLHYRFAGDPDPVFYGAYAEERWMAVEDVLTFSAGLRGERFNVTGDSTLDPRLAATLEPWSGTEVHGAWGVYHQFPRDPKTVDSELGRRDLTTPYAIHNVLGIEQRVSSNWRVRAEAFYKDYYEQIVADPQRNFSNEGIGWAYGGEAFLQRRMTGWLNGWVTYSFLHSRRKVTARDGEFPASENEPSAGVAYPHAKDQTHNVSLVANVLLPWAIHVSLRFRYATGNPYTPVDLEASRAARSDGDPATPYPVYSSDHNGARLPDYHRLDVRVDKIFAFKRWGFSVYADVINLYDRDNVVQRLPDSDFTKMRDVYDGLGFLVVGGVRFKFQGKGRAGAD
jgi:hypothetical protein